jgi:hypothetical protein
MSLDIGLADAKVTQPYPSMRISFDDDGYYWFCYPYFEDLARQTGEMIDLYGGAWFSGAQLEELDRTLTLILRKARTMPRQWDVCIGQSLGSQLAPTPSTPVYSTVLREQLLSLLAQLAGLVNEAKRDGIWIACLGD